MSSQKAIVLATYRHLWRATHIAFNGDPITLAAARRHASEQFHSQKSLEPGSLAAGQGIEHAQGVAQLLRENIVQGENKGGETWKLKIHEHTQRGENETAGRLKGTTKSFKEVKEASI